MLHKVILQCAGAGDKAAEQAGLRLMQLLVSKSGSATTADSVRSQVNYAYCCSDCFHRFLHQ